MDNKKLNELVREYLNKNKQTIVNELLDLVRIPSIKGEPTENAPYGVECSNMVDETASLMTKYGFDTVKRNDLGYTYSIFNNGGDKTIGMYSHGDVVSVDGEWLICPPFEPIIKDGFVFGRGCNDDKSGIIEMLYATKIIRDFNIPFKSNILMFTGVNEETGMGDIKAFVENEEIPDAGLVIDGVGYPCDFGERSIMRFNIVNKAKFKSIHNFYGGNSNSYNIVLPEANVVLDYSEKSFNQLKELAKNNDKYEITCDNNYIYVKSRGLASPVTTPDKGLNAGLVMIELLLKCEGVCDGDKQILSKALGFLSDGYGKGFNAEHEDCNFGKLTCGNGVISVENGSLRLAFDMRFGTELTVDELERKIKATVESEWEYRRFYNTQGYFIDKDNKYRKYLGKYYEYAIGEGVVMGGALISGGTHARYLKNTVPITNSNKLLTPEYEMPKGHGGYHQPDEKLHLDSFIDSIRILVFLLLGMDEAVNSDKDD